MIKIIFKIKRKNGVKNYKKGVFKYKVIYSFICCYMKYFWNWNVIIIIYGYIIYYSNLYYVNKI